MGESLKRFPSAHFKKVARVVVGEPDEKFKNFVQSKMLDEKQRRSDAAYKVEKSKKEKDKVLEKKVSEMEALRKKELDAKRKADEAKKEDGDAPMETKEEDAPKEAEKEE